MGGNTKRRGIDLFFCIANSFSQPNYFKASGVLALSLKAPKVEDSDVRRAPSFIFLEIRFCLLFTHTVDFVCLVDTSRSMSGGFSQQGKNKLAQVMSCFQHLVTYLADEDIFSVSFHFFLSFPAKFHF
jgi:hypothetical protein